MDHICFNQLLYLIGKGYSVNFSKADYLSDKQIIRIIVTKGDHHHMELIDISHENLGQRNTSVDFLISRALTLSEWELDNYIEQENNKELHHG